MVGEITDGFCVDSACGNGFTYGMSRGIYTGVRHYGYCNDLGIGDYIMSPLVHVNCHLALACFESFLRKGHFDKSGLVVGWTSQECLANTCSCLVVFSYHIEVSASACSW